MTWLDVIPALFWISFSLTLGALMAWWAARNLP